MKIMTIAWSLHIRVITEYYQWQTGHERWNKLRILEDSAGTRITFDRPLKLYFPVPDDLATYAEYAGKEVSLDFGGGSSLWGIPGRCLNTTTGNFVEDCRKAGGGYWPWIDLFEIPKSETTGRVYTGQIQLEQPTLLPRLKELSYSDLIVIVSVP